MEYRHILSESGNRFVILAVLFSLVLHVVGGAVFITGMKMPRSLSRPQVIEVVMVNPTPQQSIVPLPPPKVTKTAKITKTSVKPMPLPIPVSPTIPKPASAQVNAPLEVKRDVSPVKGTLSMPLTPSRDTAADRMLMKSNPAAVSNMASPPAAKASWHRNNEEVTTIGPSYDAAYLSNPVPPYPAAARRLKLQGTVTVRVLVTPDGHPKSVRLEKTSGVRLLDDAAVEAVQHWSFVPARRGDKPVAAEVDVPVRFKLN